MIWLIRFATCVCIILVSVTSAIVYYATSNVGYFIVLIMCLLWWKLNDIEDAIRSMK